MLPGDYRANVRFRTTLEAAMEEARLIEDDLALQRRTNVANGEKRKWDGSSGSSRKKANYTWNKKIDNRGEARFCNNCKSTHKGQ